MTDPAPPDSVVTWTAEGPALAAVLRCVDDAAELPLAEGVAREADRVTDLLDSPDGREGLAAFVAKRPASFA